MYILVLVFVGFLMAKVVSWSITEKNKFERLIKHVKLHQSEVNTAKAKLRSILEGSAEVYEWSLGKETQAIDQIISINGISSNQLLFSGQLYPEFTNTFCGSSEFIDQAYEELRDARTKLNLSIADYNTAINMFPASIIASKCGYKEVPQIDQENLGQALNLQARENMSFRGNHQQDMVF